MERLTERTRLRATTGESAMSNCTRYLGPNVHSETTTAGNRTVVASFGPNYMVADADCLYGADGAGSRRLPGPTGGFGSRTFAATIRDASDRWELSGRMLLDIFHA